jgi:hypothetical protein
VFKLTNDYCSKIVDQVVADGWGLRQRAGIFRQ